jgi:hypothetical protein
MLSSHWVGLLGWALAIGFSPLHLALLVVLLLGQRPLWRGCLLVVTWIGMSVLVIGLLLGMGHGFTLSMEQGTSQRTGLDLLAAGAFFALALKTVGTLPVASTSEAEWGRQLDRLQKLPLPLLLLLSAGLQVAGPEDLFVYAKAAGALFQPTWNWREDVVWDLGFSSLTSVLLLLPLLACAVVGTERLKPFLALLKSWLDRYGQRLLAGIFLCMALLVGWQGIQGLRLSGVSGVLG